MPYKPIPYWAKIPHPMSFKEATSVAVDSQDRVYIFNRGNWPLMIFDADGNFLETWGEGEFDRPHGIFIDNDDNLYMADDEGHFVDKRTPSGEIIFRLGERGKPAPGSKATPSTDQPTSSSTNPQAISSSPTAMETPASTSSTPTATTSPHGANPAHSTANSASPTTSASSEATKSSSPTAKTSASKSSAWTANT